MLTKKERQQRRTIAAGVDRQAWREYCLDMRDKNTEEFLTGDIEGYRRGFADGRDQEKQDRTDLTLAGALIICLIAGACGIAAGFVLSTI